MRILPVTVAGLLSITLAVSFADVSHAAKVTQWPAKVTKNELKHACSGLGIYYEDSKGGFHCKLSENNHVDCDKSGHCSSTYIVVSTSGGHQSIQPQTQLQLRER